MNPYFEAEKLGVELLCLDSELSYEFDLLCFFKTKAGVVFSAQDSGCSCPNPFEDYEGNSWNQIEPKLERVGSIEQAEQMIDSWNKFLDNNRISVADIIEIKEQLKAWFL